MIGLLYIVLSYGLGWAICSFAFPKLSYITQSDGFQRRIAVSPYIILLPAWYVTGTLVITWTTYLAAYLFRNAMEPLFYGNLISMPLAFAFFLLVFLKLRQKEMGMLLTKDRKAVRLEFILLLAVLLLANVLMWVTFFVSGEKLFVGVSVFSDFSPHVGMIRSFSYGNNFPTTYPHFAGEDIKYHFMFQFLAGNLEYLGLRIDYAFNLPSVISLVNAFMLLYLLAVKITGKLSAGILACLFFAFRSSRTFFSYLAEIPQGTGILKTLSENTDFISSTPNEDWGLWNLNVYCNQRHLAFGFTVILLVLLMFLTHLTAMFEDIRKYHLELRDHKRKKGKIGILRMLAGGIRVTLFTKEGWEVKEPRTAIASGILLGGLSFFHGAAVFGLLTVLFMMAVLSRRRLEYLITAIIAVLLSVLQTKLFIHGSAVDPQFFFGFIAENKTIFGVLYYLERLLGILPFVLIAALCIEKGVNKYLLLAFMAPLVFAFTVSLTIDVTVNHKYIMMSCMLLGIFVASVIVKLFEQKELMTGFLGMVLVLTLTATGVYDFITVLKKNTPNTAIVLELDNDLTNWVNENARSQDIFLTSNYTINQVVLGGAMLYEGWPYYPWSAGYDTDYRTEQVKLMYEAATPRELIRLTSKNNIRFIIIDQDNRSSQDYVVNEENIKKIFACVYSKGEGFEQTAIYDTQKLLVSE